MRLIEIYKICMEEFDKIEGYKHFFKSYYSEIEKSDIVDDGGLVESCQLFFPERENEVKNFYEYVNDIFGNIPYFFEVLYQMKQATSDSKTFIYKRKNIFDDFFKKVECIILLFETTGNLNAESIGLDIKIPATDNITEFKKYIDALEFIFTKCPFFQSDEESLRLQDVDSGSIWLIFGIVGASVAVGSKLLNNIAAFIDKCFVIRSHKLTCDRQERDVKNAEIEQEEKEELLKSIRRLYKLQVEAAVKELETVTGHKICDGDERGRAEQSLEKMEKLIDQGLRIYSSIDSPEEIKALFAPLEMHYLEIGKKLEQIEEKNKDTE